MKHSLLFMALFLLILTWCNLLSYAQVSSSFTASSSGVIVYNATTTDGWLHTDGIWVKDSAGRKVAMRMIANFPWDFSYINKSAFIQNSKAHGINVIFLGFRPPETADELPNFSFDFDAQIQQMDQIVNLIKQNGVYVGLVYLHATTPLAKNHGLTTVDQVISHLLKVWTPIIDHYKNESAVVGVKLLDEPNLSSEDEAKLWKDTIGALRQINPNLLWFTHTITELRFGEQYWHNLPWQTPSEVPYPNILMDGGIWISATNNPEVYDPYYGTTTEQQAYDRADQIYNDVIERMTRFRNTIQVPTGITPGIDDYYDKVTARTYLMTKLARWMEQNRYKLSLYSADYQLGPNDGLDVLNRVFPDTPYPYYWG